MLTQSERGQLDKRLATLNVALEVVEGPKEKKPERKEKKAHTSDASCPLVLPQGVAPQWHEIAPFPVCSAAQSQGHGSHPRPHQHLVP